MSITLYTGFVGSGKSFAATALGCRIADAPVGNRHVIANFPIKPKKLMSRPVLKKTFPYIGLQERFNEPRWTYRSNEELTIEFLVRSAYENNWTQKEGSCLLIFDEASIPFNSREWNSSRNGDSRLDWIKFLSQSRKLGYDVIFIAQDARMLDRQIRNLCEFERVHRKLNGQGIFKFFPRWVTVFAGIQYWNGQKFSKGSLHLTVYSKKVADRYDTKALFGYSQELLKPESV